MKTIISIIIMSLSILICNAQDVVYNETTASQFDKNLVSTAIQVSNAFGPDYKVNNASKVEISGPFVFHSDDMRPEIQKNEGKVFYVVTFFPQDTTSFDYGYLSKVAIWSDGKPQDVIFGNGYGRNFFFSSFEAQKKHIDLKKIPFQKAKR